MTPGLLLFLFACIAVLHLVFTVAGLKTCSHITKVLLIPFLMAWAFRVCPNALLLWALFFGWFGDVLLIKKDQTLFLRLGLFSFLVGHIVYIFLFLSRTAVFPGVVPILLIFSFYAGFGLGMFGFIRKGLGPLVIPVGGYIFTISLMSASALSFSLSDGGMAWWSFAGSLLFLLSDSLLAIRLFRCPFSYDSFFVMTTYIPAQFLLVLGILSR